MNRICQGYRSIHTNFAESGAWDVHIMMKVVASARRLLLLVVVRPTLEYGSEVWEANKAQVATLAVA